MLLLSNPRWASAGRASLLLVAAVLLHVTSASLEAVPRCPSRIDCAKAGRHFCRTGSSKCGPCLYALEENDEELCVPRKKHHQKHVKGYYKQSACFLFVFSAAISIESNIRTTQPHPPPAPKEKISKVQTFTKTPVDGTTAQPTTRPTKPTGVEPRLDPLIVTPNTRSDQIVIILVSVCVVGGTVAVILSAVCAVKLRRDSRLTEKVDYPAFGGATVAPVNGNGPAPLDHTLAQNAQMFHYQHQKQQMLSMGKQKPEAKAVDTDVTSDEEEVGGDFTVYECPGLAPTGEMEVKNPLFDDSSLPYQGNHK
ncbi:hypothetical protein NQD34_009051 [Periophthalmus magnuspinnatus]|nr:hypothetical protein NQD34_009051 [Periophthalmus magnuspinnatus]